MPILTGGPINFPRMADVTMINFNELKIGIEGGENMRDLSVLSPLELGAIVWQHRNGEGFRDIASRFRAKIWQVDKYIKEVAAFEHKLHDKMSKSISCKGDL